MNVEAAVVGCGPAGLMAAQVLAQAGFGVHVFDAMPSVGRKFLLAGKGGLNLTHAEARESFVMRYGARREAMEPLLTSLDAAALRAWAGTLGVETFVGTSGRVFPSDMKAAPLLRAWLHSLRHPDVGMPVQFHMRHRWTGWYGEDPCGLAFEATQANMPVPVRVQASVVVLALGGASWARLGSDGAWVPLLAARGVEVTPLRASNCGFDVQAGWSALFRDRFAGQPFKSVALTFTDSKGQHFSRKGEFVATATGVEGSLVYAASSLVRDEIERGQAATVYLDLLPDLPAQKVAAEVTHPRGARSLASHLKGRLRLDGIKTALLHEVLAREVFADPVRLAAAIKAVPLVLSAPRPLDEAISTAGGVVFEALTPRLMVQQLPGVFCAGEMLDWEAPTGGYLLQGCFSSGRAAGAGAVDYLRQH